MFQQSCCLSIRGTRTVLMRCMVLVRARSRCVGVSFAASGTPRQVLSAGVGSSLCHAPKSRECAQALVALRVQREAPHAFEHLLQMCHIVVW
jgi:hypothetical protein